MKTGYRKEVKLDMYLEQIGNKLNILGMVQTSDVNNILIEGLENPPCTNLRIQDGVQNGHHYCFCIISLQQDIVQMEIKCLNTGLYTSNVMKSVIMP